MQNNKKEFTREYLAQLQAELDERKATLRDEIAKRIAEARALGDLSENADYSAAREEQRINEARIAELQNDIDNAVIIERTIVTVQFVKTKETETYQIAGSQSNPFENIISNNCPLAKAIQGHKAGDKIIMTTENGTDVEIVLVDIK